MARNFRSYNINQPLLFESNPRDWLPDGHIAFFISDIVESMDLSFIYNSYRMKAGRPAYDPRLMLKLLIYGYSKGVRSSRAIERATVDDVAFRVLAANNHPDHDSIAEFRRRHLEAFHAIFLNVLDLCGKAGLLKCNHVSLDGTKVKANAKKSKSRKYPELLKSREELEFEVQMIIDQAEEIDRTEDKLYGKGKRGDEIPPELKNKKKRKALIDRLVAEIEKEAKAKVKEYPSKKEEMKKEDDEWMAETGLKFERRPPKNPTGKPVEKIIESRRNPTDYSSRIMKQSSTGGYIQGYNCQAAVDVESQVIVAADVFNQTNDKGLSRPMLDQSIKNTESVPQQFSADNGYYSERDIVWLEKKSVDPYIPPTEDSKGKRRIKTPDGVKTVTDCMREKLKTEDGKAIYGLRKMTTEPVFGQIKEIRQFRSFLLRGLDKVKAEWQLIAVAHNIGKLHRLQPTH